MVSGLESLGSLGALGLLVFYVLCGATFEMGVGGGSDGTKSAAREIGYMFGFFSWLQVLL